MIKQYKLVTTSKCEHRTVALHSVVGLSAFKQTHQVTLSCSQNTNEITGQQQEVSPKGPWFFSPSNFDIEYFSQQYKLNFKFQAQVNQI